MGGGSLTALPVALEVYLTNRLEPSATKGPVPVEFLMYTTTESEHPFAKMIWQLYPYMTKHESSRGQIGPHRD